ncbi:hypothetical protein D478_00310 [Brevibacillus agri BAB-2500]|nr:hypothetical protein D478_00310 [Brevibacillus agri BAB-2500]
MSDLMARQEPDGWQEPPREHHFAGFWIRVAASLLDSLFLVGVSCSCSIRCGAPWAYPATFFR